EGQDEKTLWGSQLKGEYLALAQAALQDFKQKESTKNIRLKRLDVSQAFASSCGQQQLVAEVEEEGISSRGLVVYPRLLRMNPQDYPLAINRYLRLQPHLPKGAIFTTIVIDLRLPRLAYIWGVTHARCSRLSS